MRETPSTLSRWLVPAGYGVIVFLLVLGAYLATHSSSIVDADVDNIVENSLRSVALLERMGNDIAQRHVITGTLLQERQPNRRHLLESELRELESDYVTAAAQYQPLATYPGERAALDRLKLDVAGADRVLDQVVRLAGAGHDGEARDLFDAGMPVMNGVDQDVATSVDLNTREAEAMRLEVQLLQRSSTRDRLFLWLLSAALTVASGAIVTRMVWRAQDQDRRLMLLLGERNRELDAFAGRVAHDLRSPLTTISLAVGMLRGVGDSSVERQSQLITRSVTRMKALIEDLLLLSRLDASTTGGHCDPKTVAAELQDDIAPRFEDVGARLYVSLEPGQVHCTDGLLRQVLANLVENAFKYRRGEVPAEIAVSGRPVARGYEIRVADNGIGMSPDELGHAFDPLYRARRVPDVPGTGLGLSIVKRVVERYGGSIGIASQLGRGSTVTMVLPMNPAPSQS